MTYLVLGHWDFHFRVSELRVSEFRISGLRVLVQCFRIYGFSVSGFGIRALRFQGLGWGSGFGLYAANARCFPCLRSW